MLGYHGYFDDNITGSYLLYKFNALTGLNLLPRDPKTP